MYMHRQLRFGVHVIYNYNILTRTLFIRTLSIDTLQIKRIISHVIVTIVDIGPP